MQRDISITKAETARVVQSVIKRIFLNLILTRSFHKNKAEISYDFFKEHKRLILTKIEVENMVIDFGIKGLIVHDNKFLAIHKKNISDKTFELPGGRMQFGETIEETLKREVFEETGVHVEPLKLLDTWNYINNERTHQVAGVIYLCKKIDEHLTITLSAEHDRYEWLSSKNLNKMNRLFYPKMSQWNWEKLFF